MASRYWDSKLTSLTLSNDGIRKCRYLFHSIVRLVGVVGFFQFLVTAGVVESEKTEVMAPALCMRTYDLIPQDFVNLRRKIDT